jgi:hypothetical protein
MEERPAIITMKGRPLRNCGCLQGPSLSCAARVRRLPIVKEVGVSRIMRPC